MLTYHLQINVARDTCSNRKSCSEIPTAKVESCTDDKVGNLGDGLSADECNPVIRFGLRIDDLVRADAFGKPFPW